MVKATNVDSPKLTMSRTEKGRRPTHARILEREAREKEKAKERGAANRAAGAVAEDNDPTGAEVGPPRPGGQNTFGGKRKAAHIPPNHSRGANVIALPESHT